MIITKFGHCCLLVETDGARILIDPGNYSTSQNEAENIDLILITHEHEDHCDTSSLGAIIAKNPDVRIITNSGVGKVLDEKNIPHSILEDGGYENFRGVLIEAFGKKHAEIYRKEVPLPINTGYFIAQKFFYPGDAFFAPGKPIEVLALPVCGPWMKIADALDYLKVVHPQKAFPVHDGMLLPERYRSFHKRPEWMMEKLGGKFIVPKQGEPMEF